MNQQFDPVTKPKHYNSHPSGVECITITRHFSFNLGNVIKYLWRAPLKSAELEDMKKARYYLDDEIKRMEASREEGYRKLQELPEPHKTNTTPTHVLRSSEDFCDKPKRKKKLRINKKAFMRP